MKLSKILMLLFCGMILVMGATPVLAEEEAAAEAALSVETEMKEFVPGENECPEVDELVEVEDVTDEDLSYAAKISEDMLTMGKKDGHHHSCRTKSGTKKALLPNAVVGPNKCEWGEARDAVRLLAAAQVCNGQSDPECHGICADDKECKEIMKKGTGRLTCVKQPNAACPRNSGWVCTAQPANNYRCKCACRH